MDKRAERSISNLKRETLALGALVEEGLFRSFKAYEQRSAPLAEEVIAADDVMTGLSHTSKLNADWEFITSLRDAGRAHADAWLKENFDKLGREATVDIRGTYL